MAITPSDSPAESIMKKPSPPTATVLPASGAGPDIEAGATDKLQRGMNKWHLQFIAIGSTLGTGLFLGSGQALAQAGPVSCLIAFLFVGCILFSVMSSMGEMATYIPIAGSFTAYAARFVDRSLGFALGWIYWFSWAITFALELVGSGLIIQYWSPDLNVGIFIAIFWAIFTGINFLPVRWYGEIEMWFSSIKVVTVLGFIIFAICINAGVGEQGYLGFKYWVTPGAFKEYIVEGDVGRFVGFWSVLVTAGFSYQGAELVGVGAGETRDPHKSIPSAVRWTFWGVLFLFMATVFFTGILVPSDNDSLLNGTTNANSSPLVIAANLAGVPVLPDILNAVLLTAVLSAANSNVYSSSRILLALAKEKNGPQILTWTNSYGTPYVAVAVSSAVGLLAFLNLSASGANVFDWLLNITAIAGFISWTCIIICHLRFMNALRFRGIDRRTLPYMAPFQPYLAWFGLFFCTLILITNGFTAFIGWSTIDFFAAYISIILFVVLYVGHKLVFRNRPLRLDEVDLDQDRVVVGEEENEKSSVAH